MLVIAIGGALGAIARYLIEKFFPSPPGTIPWATLIINISGSFLLGVVVTLTTEIWDPSPYKRAFLGVGFCGGYTTFSTWMVESALLINEAKVSLALGYVLISLVLGVIAVYIGIVLVRLVGRLL